MMTVPKCPNGGAARWTATYRVQAERTWSIGEGDSEPTLDHEDGDFGEWDDVRCATCHQPPSDEMRPAVLDRMLGAAGQE